MYLKIGSVHHGNLIVSRRAMLTAVRQVSEGKQNKQNHFGNIVWFVPICRKDRHQIRYWF